MRGVVALGIVLALAGCESLLGLGEVDYRPVATGGAGAQGGAATTGGGGTGGSGGAVHEPGDRIWNTTVVGELGQRGLRLAVDAADRTYAVGQLDGAVDIPPLRENEVGQPEALLIALDPAGTPQRSRNLGGTGSIELSLAVDGTEVFVAGGHRSVDLSPSAGVELSPACSTLPVDQTNCGNRNAAAIKYDAEFDLRWWRDEGILSDDELIRGIDVVDGDPVFLASYTAAQTFFDTALTAPATRECLVVRLTNGDDTAPAAWAQSLGDPDRSDSPRALIAHDDRIAVLIDTSNGTARGMDVHVLDATTGNAIWTTPFTLEGDVRAQDIVADGNGGYLVTARLVGPATSPMALTPVGTADGLLLHLDALGNLTDLRQWTGRTKHLELARAPDGSLALAGTFLDELVIDGSLTLPGDPEHDTGFVLELDPTGQVVWSHVFAGSSLGEAEMRDVAFAPNGDIVVVGSWAGKVLFDFGELESRPAPTNGTAADAWDMIVIRYAP